MEDNDEQRIDSIFGLGLVPPEEQLAGSQSTNLLEWMVNQGYIDKKMASIYFSNYDATEEDKYLKAKKEYNLPSSHI